jgi:hypothetical protein
MEASNDPAVNDRRLPSRSTAARKTGLLLCALLAASPCASYAQWKVIHSEAANFVEFDPSTVRDAPPFRLAWTRITFTSPQRGEEADYQSQGQLHAVDCSARRSTVVGMVNYSGALGQGTASTRQTRPRGEWVPKAPPPGSLAELIIELSCREAARQ